MKPRSVRRTPARATREPILLVSVALAGGVLAVSTLESCRKPAPDEIVNDGRFHPPSLDALPGTGGTTTQPTTGGSGGTAGKGGTTSGSGGASSTSSTGGSTSGDGGTPPGEAGTGGSAGGGEPEPTCDPITPSTEPFSKRALLEATAACVTRQYCLFQGAATTLHEKARAHADEQNETTLAAARDAWREAMAIWEEAEMFQIGPAATASNPGGQGLRDLVHSWPLVARCKVDEQTVNRFYANASFLGSASASASSGRTLHALEYLLFYSGLDNGCTAYSTINSTGTWADLSETELRGRKADYAARAAEDVLRQADALALAWSPDGGDFATTLVELDSVFTSEQSALNSVSNALFYTDDSTKDLKIGVPVGLHADCPAERCPASVEALYAGTSVDHIRRNLAGFRKLFQGCAEGSAGIGFDDWLLAVGADDLNTRMLAALDGAEAAFAALDAPLEVLITTDPARVQATHAALKRLTDLYKTEFITILNLEPPGGPGAVDND